MKLIKAIVGIPIGLFHGLVCGVGLVLLAVCLPFFYPFAAFSASWELDEWPWAILWIGDKENDD